MIVFDTVPFCMADGETALAEVNPVEGAESVRHDFRLVSASRLVGTVLDPQGKPLLDAYYSGFSPTSQWFYWPAIGGKFAVNGYSPDEPRTVLLVDLTRKLAGSVILQGPQTTAPEREAATLGRGHRAGGRQGRQTDARPAGGTLSV